MARARAKSPVTSSRLLRGDKAKLPLRAVKPPVRKRPKSDNVKEVPPKFMEPMKALGVTSIPPGDWLLELKFDGYRALSVLNERKVKVWSRNRNDLSADYPEIVEALKAVRCDSAILDGEIVALDPSGRPRFQLLQNRDRPGPRAPLVYYVFDLLQRDGRSLLKSPIEERQRELRRLFGKGNSGTLRVSPVFRSTPSELLAEVKKQGLEGIVAKRAGSTYEPGVRSGAWMKCKINAEQEFVIGGFTPPQNSRPHFGAILVGYFQDGEFMYAGKVGSGFDHAKLASLHEQFLSLRIPGSPFANLPLANRSRFGAGMTSAVMKAVTWVRPELVCQVRFSEWTEEGLLRQPVFLGLRTDKPATSVHREAGAARV